MATFYDDFERANGALGGNWVSNQGSVVITSGTASGSVYWLATYTGVSDNHRSEAIVRTTRPASSAYSSGPAVRTASSGTSGYSLGVYNLNGNYSVVLRAAGIINSSSLGSYAISGTPLPYFTLRLIWDDGHLSGYYDGVLVVEANDAGNIANVYSGIQGYSTAAPAIDFTSIGGSAPGLIVTPTIIGNYGTASHMAAAGVNTAWTPGTPGAPTLSVDHGTVSVGAVQDATHMTFDFDPGAYLGGVTFRDPTTGSTAIVMVSSDPNVVPPSGSYGFTPQAVAMVNNTAGESFLEKLTKPNTPVSVSGYANLELETLLGTVALNTGATVDPDVGSRSPLTEDLYARVWGGEPWQSVSFVPAGAGSLKLDTADAVSRLETLITANHWTLGDVIVQLAGEGVKTHLDLWNAIAELGGGTSVDLTSVLDAIAAARGLDAPSIRTVADLVGDLSTAAGYNLGDVHGWIAGIPEADLSAVTAKLALMQPSTAYNLSTVAAQAASLITAVTAIKVELDEVRALVEGLEIPVAGGAVAPLWPGEANVTIGASQALSNGLVVDGPMHGILLTITGHPAHNTRYAFGAVSSWARVGQVVFRSDRGDYERSQSFSMDAQVMVPATMEAAEAVTVRLNEGWTGTVRAWSRA